MVWVCMEGLFDVCASAAGTIPKKMECVVEEAGRRRDDDEMRRSIRERNGGEKDKLI